MKKAFNIFILLSFLSIAGGGIQAKGLINQQAAEINDLDWVGVNGKAIKVPSIKEHKGSVVILKFWQSWCPGCLRKGLPDLKKLQEHFKNNKKVKLYTVQTVFEGSHTNTKEKLNSIRREYGLTIPMAHDDGSKFKKARSILMERYKTRGTPWFVIIDTKQKVVFNDFHLDPDKAIKFIEKMLLVQKKGNK